MIVEHVFHFFNRITENVLLLRTNYFEKLEKNSNLLT